MVISVRDKVNGYEVDEITLYPYDSDIDKEENGIEISNLVTKFSITESIYYLGLTMEMTIVDGVNIVEKFGLSGNEKIKIKLDKFDKNLQQNTSIDLNFIVINYPLYGKSDNRKFQAFKIEAVTTHTYLNMLISSSQFISGSPSSMIKHIMTNTLMYDEAKIINDDDTSTLYDYIVPNLRPLNAIRNILKTTCDNNSSPIIAWETLKGFKISSYINLLQQIPYKNRIYRVSSFTDPILDENEKYLKDITSILSFTSNLKMSKIEQVQLGGFSSKTKHYELSNKTYTEGLFDIEEVLDDYVYLSNHTSFSNQFTIDDKPLNKHYEAMEINVVTIDKQSTNIVIGNNINLHEKIKTSYLAQAEHQTHLLLLHGDFDFSSGNIIEIIVPSEKNQDSNTDNYFSGKYLVSTITHSFQEDYRMEVKIQRDGQSIKLE